MYLDINNLRINIDMIVSTLLLLAFILNGYLFYRNYKVFKEREKIRKLIFIKDENDNYIYSTSEITELLLEMDKAASYYQMLLKIWIPVKQFYTDFVDKIEKRRNAKS